MVIVYTSQQTNTCSKSATVTLEITEDNPNEKIFKKQPPEVFYKKSICKYFVKLTGKYICQNYFFNKVGGIPEKWDPGP